MSKVVQPTYCRAKRLPSSCRFLHDQFGIGIVSARIAEAVLQDERGVFPVGAFNGKYGVTLSLPAVVGRQGVSRILEPAMSDEERQALRASAEVLRKAVARIS